MLSHSLYHKCLRVSLAVMATVLLFHSGILPGTEALSRHADEYLANAVSMSASVEPNDLNVITAALTEQKQALEVREKALQAREIQVHTADQGTSFVISNYVLSGAVLLLLILVILNYVFDFLRARTGLRTYAKVG